MKYIKYIGFFLIAAAMLLSIGCKTTSVAKSSSVNVRDSISYKEITTIKDSLVYTDVDSARIRAMVVCPDGKPLDIKPIVKKSKQATATFEIKNGVASIDCDCDSVGIISRFKNTEKTAFKERLSDAKTEIKETVKVPYYPMWMKVLAGIGVAGICYAAFKVIKLFKLI
jgi:hypothetical protein